MSELTLISMLVLGFAGTGHCVGMCGPLIVAFPARATSPLAHVIYHCGRIATYTLIGAVAGWLGSGSALGSGSSESLLLLTRIQGIVSALAALLMLILGLVRLGLIAEPPLLATASPTRIPGFARAQAAAALGRSLSAMFIVGLLLGLLPCGLSYAAFARALAADGAIDGALLLLAFGAGTLPGLLGVGLGAAAVFQRHRKLLDLISGVIVIGMAVSLLADVVVML